MRGLVLLTRPEPGATATARALRAAGWEPLGAPLLRIEPCRPVLPPPEALQAVLITSANAVPGLPAAYYRLPLLAVGRASAEAARAAGFAEVRDADGDAVALGGLAASALRPGGAPLLLAAGAGQGGVLAARLRAAGFAIHHATTYGTRPATVLPPAAAAAWAHGALHAALFFSAETARVFARLVDNPAPAAGITALAIAPAVGAALAPLPWRHIRVAVKPTQEALLALLT